MADEEKKEGEGEAGGGGGGKSKLIMIIAGVLVLAGGGGAAFMFMGGDSAEPVPAEGEAAAGEGEAAAGEGEAAAGEGEAAAGEGEAAQAKPAEGEGKGAAASSEDEDGPKRPNIEFGETYKLADFHLNLGNPLENHYMTMSISLEYRNGEQQEQEIILREPQIRDAVISVVTRKTREFLLSPDGKAQLRLEILNRVNQYMDKKIEAVYFNEFMVE